MALFLKEAIVSLEKDYLTLSLISLLFILNIISIMNLLFTIEKKRSEGKHHYDAIIAYSTKLLRKIFTGLTTLLFFAKPYL